MKRAFLTAALAVLSIPLHAVDDNTSTSSPWVLSQPAYGQFRLVPDKVVPHVTEPKSWEGPWGRYANFVLRVDSAAGQAKTPEKFDFVEPRIELQGSSDTSKEAESTTVQLFDRPSSAGDIQVVFASMPDPVQLDTEYKLGTIFGKDAITSWDVYVRFTSKKPDYVRESDKSEPAK